MGRASSVALGGAVHIGCVVPPETRIPIGWAAGRGEQMRAAMSRYTATLARAHRDDK